MNALSARFRLFDANAPGFALLILAFGNKITADLDKVIVDTGILQSAGNRIDAIALRNRRQVDAHLRISLRQRAGCGVERQQTGLPDAAQRGLDFSIRGHRILGLAWAKAPKFDQRAQSYIKSPTGFFVHVIGGRKDQCEFVRDRNGGCAG